MPTLMPVILCGGSGTRLWPLSREQYPKQLLPLLNTDDSLLQTTVRRMEGLKGVQLETTMVVCNEEHRFVIAEQLRVMNKTATILLEPAGRNTAPALTLAALAANQGGDDPILLVMPADHVIMDTISFHSVVHKSIKLAAEGAIITFGITPDSPETGYGYIQSGKKSSEDGFFHIERFVEKPDFETAQSYLDDGSYLWNSGLFMMRASVWLSAIGYCHPDILNICQTAWDKNSIDGNFLRVERSAFEQCPAKSIDYAVMENITTGNNSLPTGLVTSLSAGWSDIGAWDSLWKILPKDDRENVSQGDVLLHNCHSSFIMSGSRLVACVGVENIVVVETPDAILVAHKDKTQNVKKIVDSLKHGKRAEGQLHRKVFRPWGWYDCVDIGGRFQVKRIVVNPGASLSLQLHHHRAEHWIVVSGTAQVTRGDDKFLVAENESTFIPLGTRHRLENLGSKPLEIIEVQSGSYLGEDDIVRFEDIYGR